MSLKEQAYRGAQWTTFSSVCNAVVQLLRVAILARLLEKSDFGLMAIVMMIMGFMALFSDMGIGSAILHRQNISQKEYSSLYWLNFLISLILFLSVCILSVPISVFYDEHGLIVLIPVMASNLFITAFGRQYSVFAQKKLQFKFISIVEIITNIVSLIPAVVLALKGFGVYALIYSTLFASLFSNICFFLKFQKTHKICFHFQFSDTKPFLQIGLYQTGSQILNYFNTQLDVIIIGKFLGMDTLGLYNLAKNLAMRPMQIINPILTKLSAPLLAKVQSDANSLKRNYLKIINILSFINFPIHLLMAVLSLPIINILYGMNNNTMAIVLSLLSVYYALRSIGNPVGGLVIATGKTHIEFYWNVIMIFVFPVFVSIGSLFSVEGAAFSQLLLMVLAYIPSWYFLVRKLVTIPLKEYVMKSVPYLLFCIVSGLITYLLLKVISIDIHILNLFIGTCAFITIYCLEIYLFNRKFAIELWKEFIFSIRKI